MGERERQAKEYLERYVGKSGPLLLAREMKKNGISDIDCADQLSLMNLTESIIKDVLSTILSRGRLPLARSELMGILGIGEGLFGIPVEIDGVKVLPDDITEKAAQRYESESEFIIRKELERYGLKSLKGADSKVRVRVLEAFVEHHFGPSGKAIIDCRVDEMGVRDVCKCPMYNRILLMEYILQCMLQFYVKPMRARMLRSELIAILDVDVEAVQGSPSTIERAERTIKGIVSKGGSSCAHQAVTDFEDLLDFLLKRELSRRGLSSLDGAAMDVRNDIALEVLSQMLGGMTSFVFTNILTADERIRMKFICRYVMNFMRQMMAKDDAERFFVRVSGLLSISDGD